MSWWAVRYKLSIYVWCLTGPCCILTFILCLLEGLERMCHYLEMMVKFSMHFYDNCVKPEILTVEITSSFLKLLCMRSPFNISSHLQDAICTALFFFQCNVEGYITWKGRNQNSFRLYLVMPAFITLCQVVSAGL